jgi:hypothetical protein
VHLDRVEPFDAEIAEMDVDGAEAEEPHGVAHRRRAVAAPARLMEHQRTVPGREVHEERGGLGGDVDPGRAGGRHQKNPIGPSA